MNEAQKFDWTRASDDELARSYQALQAGKERMDEKIRTLDTELAAIRAALLARMESRGQTSFSTATATIVKSRTMKVSCASEAWPQFYQWLYDQMKRLEKAKGDPRLVFAWLHRRVTKDEVETYMAVNEGRVPPGINVLPEYTVSVKKRSEAAQRRAAA